MQVFRSFFLFVVVLFITSCSSEQSDKALVIASAIVKDVGKIKLFQKGKTDKLIIIFEENHLSSRCQYEIAIMLTRMREKHSMKTICLEGLTTRIGNLNASWFHNIKSLPNDYEKQITARRLLREGEISDVELIALLFPDISVIGIEDEQEYNVNLSTESNPQVMYLLYIALSSLSPENYQHFQELYNAAKDSYNKFNPENVKQAFEYAINADSWTAEKYKQIDERNRIISTKELLKRINEIEKYAEEKGIKDKIDPKIVESMENLKKFYETAEKRSVTMVKNTLLQTEQNKDIAVAMVIGAAHSALIAELLKDENACFAIITPLALKNENVYSDPSNITIQAFQRKNSGYSVDENTIGNILDGRRKPSPVISKNWFKKKTNIYLFTRRIALIASGGPSRPLREVPTNKEELKTRYEEIYGAVLSDINVDWNLVSLGSGGEVLFSVNVNDDRNNPNRIWIKAKSNIKDTEGSNSLEQQLLDDLKEIKNQEAREHITNNGLRVIKIGKNAFAAFSRNMQELSSLNIQTVWQ